MQSFANLKRTSSDIEKLNEAVDALNQNNFQQDDENFWKPEVDKVGNGFAIIRFLPTPPQDGDDGLPGSNIGIMDSKVPVVGILKGH